MNKKHMLTTGEFARLCRTTKQTLFHYDREGLLCPRHVSENGYRRYGAEQFFDYDMISVLKETGSTLKEIRACLPSMHSAAFLALLEEKRRAVKKERERLARRESMLQDMAALTREALDFAYDTLTVRQQEEERLEIFPALSEMPDSSLEYVQHIAEYLGSCGKNGRIPRYPFGAILDRVDVAQGRYLERFFFSRATRGTPRTQLHVKPQGLYAVFAHKGTEDSHPQTFKELLRQIRAAGLSVTGNTYIYDMMNAASPGSGEKYALKYCVCVGAAPDNAR